MKRFLPLLVVALVACGDKPTAPSHVDVGGTWLITFSNLSSGGVSCSSNPGNMSLSMSGVTFSGTYGPIAVSCSDGADTTLQGTVVNGTVGVTAVNFDLGTSDFHQTGETSGCLPGECDIPFPFTAKYMSGTASWTIDLGGGQPATLIGSWSAGRQSPAP